MRIRFCITTAATATVFQRRNVCYDVPLHVWVIGAFAAAGHRLWISLPAELRQPDLSLG